MGLFSKKLPCPICGGKISWFLPTKIEKEYICDDCAGKIDLPNDTRNSLSMIKLREYLNFYEENQHLREKFIVSDRVDFGLWDTKLIFDYTNHLFCMSNNPDKTIYEGRQLKSFVIKEDRSLIYEGSAVGLKRYESTVREEAMALMPRITQYAAQRRRYENMERMQRMNERAEQNRNDHDHRDHNNQDYHHPYQSVPTMNIPEPFRDFKVELYLDHPYWKVITCDMKGPIFSNTYPDVNDYLNDYATDIRELERLVRALMTVAFPNAKEYYINRLGQVEGQPQNQTQSQSEEQSVSQTAAATPAPDMADEIRKLKALLDEGLISNEEYYAKKKQVLGI